MKKKDNKTKVINFDDLINSEARKMYTCIPHTLKSLCSSLIFYISILPKINLKEFFEEQRLHSKRETRDISRSFGYSSLISDPDKI